MNIELSSLTTAQLRRAADLKEKIETLNKELASLFGGSVAGSVKVPGRGKMSAAGRAKIAAAQKARWAKLKTTKSSAKSPRKKMSAAAKAKISAAAKARWAKAKASGKTSL